MRSQDHEYSACQTAGGGMNTLLAILALLAVLLVIFAINAVWAVYSTAEV